jgi:hypothetical protein
MVVVVVLAMAVAVALTVAATVAVVVAVAVAVAAEVAVEAAVAGMAELVKIFISSCSSSDLFSEESSRMSSGICFWSSVHCGGCCE